MGPPRQQPLSIDVQKASKTTTTVERELTSTDAKKNTNNNNCSNPKVQAHTPSTLQSCESQLFRFEEEDESDDDIGDGGVLTETQLVLLCLDYLRTLSRSYTTEELRTCHSMDRGALLKATDSLRQSFLPTTTTPSGSSQLLQPAQLHTDNDPVRSPQTPTSSSKNPHKLDYDDSHPSNRYRFFPLNGLSTPPLTLGEIVASGLVGLNARSRGEAELDICSNELFHQFLGAVKARGFFATTTTDGNQKGDTTSPTTSTETERYQRVVDKFRMKLAANAAKEAQAASRLSPLSIYSSTSMSPTTMSHHRPTTATTTTPHSIASPKNIPCSTTSITTATMATRPDSTRVLAMTMAEKQRVHQQKQQQRQQPYSFDDHDDDYTNAAQPAITVTSTRDIEQREEQNEDEGGEEEENNDLIEIYNPVDVQRAEKYKLSGNNYSEAGKFDKAVDCYTQALQLCPSGSNSHIYYSNRSAAFLGLERYEDCLDDCERALALKPDYVKAYTRMGWALFYLKEYEYAMDSFEMSMKLDPTNAHTHRDPYLKAREAWEKEQRQQQQGPREEEQPHTNNQNAYFHDNDNNSPKSATSSQTSPRTTSTGMDEESRRNRESMIRQKEADGYKAKGNSYMAHRDWVRAVEAYSTAIQLCPNGPRSYVYFANRSAALCHLQQYEEAELDAADSVALNPEYGKAYARLGLSRFFLEDYHGAVEAYENAIYYEPDNAASKSYLAKAKKHVLELNGGGITE